jgi:N-acetylglucosaminyl-diphospho-decaprenol L-rhamnosyltransferase
MSSFLPLSNPVSVSNGSRFAVIIVNYNGGAMLVDCVRSALREQVAPERIILVDNGSRDGSIDAIESEIAGLTLLRNPCNAGFARAVNQSIRHALSQAPEFVLLLNNDAELDPGALFAFSSLFERWREAAIVGGQLRYPDGRLQSAFAPFPSVAEELVPRPLLRLVAPRRFARKTQGSDPVLVECVLGACFCVRASALPQLGLLDEDFFFFFEEIEWCRRAARLGMQVYYLPAARAVHRGGQTANRFRGPARVEYQRSKLTFFRKTRPPAAYLAVSAFLVIRTLVNALAGSLACIATLFLKKRLRGKAWTYWYLFCWHLLLRPSGWGLPDKCPGNLEVTSDNAIGSE